MRKNLFIKSFALMALSLAALSCAKEGTDADSQQSEVSFSVEVPAAPATKGLSDASTTNELICQVFLDNKDKTTTLVPELTQKVDIDVTTHKASVKFSLVKGNSYTFIFWAQTRETGYYNTDDLRSVKMNCDVVKANDPAMDAFCATKTMTATVNPTSKSVILTRVLAQVNFGTVIPDRSDALKVKSSSMTLTNVPDTFHPLLGQGSTSCEGRVNITFQDNTAVTDEKLIVEGTDYDYISTVYVFVPRQNKIITDASTTVTLENGKTTKINAPNAPIQGNCRTNILGDLLTVDGTWNISIDSRFGNDVIYDEISSKLASGGSVTLGKDYSVNTSEWRGINIPSGVESVLNLGGHRFANENGKADAKAALVVKGTLTINGDGDVYCEGSSAEKAFNNAILVQEGGHLIINGGSYSVGKDASGKCNSTIYVENIGKTGKVEIYGGTFTNEEGSNGHAFVLNQDDEIIERCISVYGGIFIGFNPADNTSEGEHTNFVADGYKSVEIEYNGKQAWKVEQE